jgi:hypothetical protein
MGFVGGMLFNLLILQFILYLQWRTNGLAWYLVLFSLYGFLLLVPVTHLFGFHCYLTAKNLTTNEVINSHRYVYLYGADGKYRNPFDRGLFLNLVDRCVSASTAVPSIRPLLPEEPEAPESCGLLAESLDHVTTNTSRPKQRFHDVAMLPV